MSPIMDAPDQDSAFVALLTDHQSAIRCYVAALLPGEPSAADVAQQANATIWKKRESFELGTNFKAWAFSIVRYEVLSFRKRQARDQARLVFSDETHDLLADELTDRVDDLPAREAALRHCLESLKSSDRDLIQHRYYHRSPLNEYAEKAGRSVDGLKVTLHRIRSALADCINRNMSERGRTTA